MHSKSNSKNNKPSIPPKKQNDNIKITSEYLNNRPVTITELDVIETYAGDLIRGLVSDQLNSNQKE
ncbi:MAG: hypothetical protein COC00_012480 [Rhizobiales bacterium]|uniref:Uncharacterized protein n=1 Tax=OCS116 cluster bacterium TaxID=2030921 RepID=A0A2A4YYY8_9PROT|nr:hypothetical protein [Hyphomicrobiales bacterium]